MLADWLRGARMAGRPWELDREARAVTRDGQNYRLASATPGKRQNHQMGAKGKPRSGQTVWLGRLWIEFCLSSSPSEGDGGRQAWWETRR